MDSVLVSHSSASQPLKPRPINYLTKPNTSKPHGRRQYSLSPCSSFPRLPKRKRHNLPKHPQIHPLKRQPLLHARSRYQRVSSLPSPLPPLSSFPFPLTNTPHQRRRPTRRTRQRLAHGQHNPHPDHLLRNRNLQHPQRNRQQHRRPRSDPRIDQFV